MTNEIEQPITCKLCDSTNVVKFGTYNDTQFYYCKDCQRKFKADDSLFGGRVPASHISSALSMYYTGMSLADIADHLKQETGYKPSTSSVWEWIDKYTDKAIKYYDQFTPQVGGVLVADETVINWWYSFVVSRGAILLPNKSAEGVSNDATIQALRIPQNYRSGRQSEN